MFILKLTHAFQSKHINYLDHSIFFSVVRIGGFFVPCLYSTWYNSRLKVLCSGLQIHHSKLWKRWRECIGIIALPIQEKVIKWSHQILNTKRKWILTQRFSWNVSDLASEVFKWFQALRKKKINHLFISTNTYQNLPKRNHYRSTIPKTWSELQRWIVFFFFCPRVWKP